MSGHHLSDLKPLDFYMWTYRTYMKELVYHKLQAQDKPLQHIIDNSFLKQNNHKSISKARHNVLKRTHLFIDKAGGNFKHQAT